MKKHHKHQKQSSERVQANINRQQQTSLQRQVITPGRAPAEGPAIDSPTHERWEQETPDRDPVEGPDF